MNIIERELFSFIYHLSRKICTMFTRLLCYYTRELCPTKDTTKFHCKQQWKGLKYLSITYIKNIFLCIAAGKRCPLTIVQALPFYCLKIIIILPYRCFFFQRLIYLVAVIVILYKYYSIYNQWKYLYLLIELLKPLNYCMVHWYHQYCVL